MRQPILSTNWQKKSTDQQANSVFWDTDLKFVDMSTNFKSVDLLILQKIHRSTDQQSTNLVFWDTLLQNTNVIGDSKQNTICPLGRYEKIGVFSCCKIKIHSCMCVVLTDLPFFICVSGGCGKAGRFTPFEKKSDFFRLIFGGDFLTQNQSHRFWNLSQMCKYAESARFENR